MIILIDNDKFIRLSWMLKAKQAHIEFLAFEKISELIEKNLSNKDHIKVYVDSNLDGGIKGEIESERLSEQGYKEIYLTTGYDDLIIGDYPWLKGIVSKSPPF